MFSRLYSRLSGFGSNYRFNCFSARRRITNSSSKSITPKLKRSSHWTLGGSNDTAFIPPRTTNLLQTLKVIGFIGAVTLATAVLIHRDEVVPYTQRARWAFLPPPLEAYLGNVIASSMAKRNRASLVDPQHPLALHIKLVGDRICAANGLPEHRFILVKSPGVNAFALPGRNVFVFTGLLPVMHNQAGLAMVLGHEMSHCLAGHGSDAMAVTMPMAFVVKTIGGSIAETVLPEIINLGFTLRKSRKNEHEADIMGLHLMTAACFDRKESISVFQRMGKATNENENDIEWAKTHPNWNHRIEVLQEWMDSETMKKQCLVCDQLRHSLFSQGRSSLGQSLGLSPPSTSWEHFDFLRNYDYSQKLPRMKDEDFKKLWPEDQNIFSLALAALAA